MRAQDDRRRATKAGPTERAQSDPDASSRRVHHHYPVLEPPDERPTDAMGATEWVAKSYRPEGPGIVSP